MMKYILAVAFVAPFLTVSSMAQDASSTVKHVYQGGPKTTIPHATRQVSSGGDIFAMEVKAKKPRTYRGAPGR